jgi:hypothetical protein
MICRQSDDYVWVLPYLQAAVRAWWIIEYSGWFIEPVDVSTSKEGTCAFENLSHIDKHAYGLM